ncbi:MAG TPA: tRNA lysidine(34) synthetase TilS, partial [Kofleriaceae bacterium]
MSSDPVSTLRAAVKLWNDRLAPGLFGLACSGGADSMALADAAIAELGASNVVVIHIDHGLSPTSALVGEQVASWARGQGVAAVVRRVEVERRASIEAAARDARYAALDAIRLEIGASWILLGHTARDQAETVMMRIVRGTGPAGLAGIPMIRGRF